MQINKTLNLDLLNLNGNAYSILAAFKQQAKKEAWTTEEISYVLTIAKSRDYDHLVSVILSYCNDSNISLYDKTNLDEEE
jgi:hypothetical protein